MTSRSSQWAWVMYDFGNSAYALIVMTLFYPLFFARHVAPGPRATALWGITAALSVLLVGVIGPALGAYADQRTNRKGFFIVFSSAAIFGTALLPITGYVPWALGALLFVFTNFCFGVALYLYDSFLVVVADVRQPSTSLSGKGWAAGYIGGIVCLGLVYLIAGRRLPASQQDYTLVFVVTSIFYLAVAIWPFKALPGDTMTGRAPVDAGVWHALKSAWATLRNWRSAKRIFVFLLAMYFVMDGMTTIVYFVSLYAKDALGFTVTQTVLLLTVTQLVAVPFTWGVAAVAARAGEVVVLIACSLLWCFIVLAMYAYSDMRDYWWIAGLTGVVVGSTPAVARGYLAKIIPPARRAEMFGFNSTASRIAALFGPVLFGVLSTSVGMKTALLLAVLPFFAVGVVLLLVVQAKAHAWKAADA